MTLKLTGKTYLEESRIGIKKAITVQEGVDLRVEYNNIYIFKKNISLSVTIPLTLNWGYMKSFGIL
ncbi:hypothetical protein CEE45_02050 [Candidatus Heimdallarchaeota archaeon B3_Heim]|nr:MAG: hypothetical protein CEE45_02050 [Candidatus Heimdallarchaeota archaeon B3_Heim]